jgi:hypothetical protein
MTWQYLFDSEAQQRSDIESLKRSAHIASDTIDDAITRAMEAHQRIARLELTVEALIRLLELRGGLARQELALMIQQIDLADGVEDGRIGPDRTASARRCEQCARPLNPKRSSCIYCGAAISAAPAKPPEPPRMTECRRCTKSIEEVQAYITMRGLWCPECYANYEEE